MRNAEVNVELRVINHPILGAYNQLICDTVEEAGHRRLPSGGRFGWGMPTDPATASFVRDTVGKAVLDLGSGVGDVVVLPALAQGASVVYATNIEKEQELFGSFSVMARGAALLGKSESLRASVISEQWWDRELQDRPTITSILGISASSDIPEDGSIDLMIARHSA